MKTTRKFLGISSIFIFLFAFAGFAVAQVEIVDVREVRTEAPAVLEHGDVAPLDSRSDLPILTPLEAAPVMRTFSGGHEPAPVIPGEAMDIDSRDIYIYVTLLAPEGPDPPDTIKIISENCNTDDEQIEFKTDLGPTGYYGDFFNVYRDTLPLFFLTQLDTTDDNRNLIGRTVIRFFTDDFTGTAELPDTLWRHYWNSSKGVCDTLVNLFYTFTTVDTGASAPDGFAESRFPSQCVCEYDQPIYAHATLGTRNWLSIPNYDENYEMCSDLEGLGVRKVMEWDPVTQIPLTVGDYLFPLGWVANNPLKIGHVYQVLGDYSTMSDSSTFQTYTPGIIPALDTVYTLAYDPTLGGRNVIILPFRASIVENITDRASLETSVEDIGSAWSVALMKIDVWDGSAFIWNTISEYNIPFAMWTTNPHLRPGNVYRIWITGTGTVSFSWPIS
jgi:hypothetical protein